MEISPAFLLVVLLTQEFKRDQEFPWQIELDLRQKELMYGSKQQRSSKKLYPGAEV